MININKSYITLIDREKDKSDARLRFRVKWDKEIVAFNVGFRVDVDKWSTESQRCNKNTTHGKKKVASSKINSVIQKHEEAIEQLFSIYENSDKTPSALEFRNDFNTLIGKVVVLKTNKTAIDYMFDFTKEMGLLNQWTTSTYQKFNALKNHIEYHDSGVTFENITEEWLSGYVNYLRNVQDMRNTTILKHLSFLKWFLRWATDKEYNTNMDFKKFMPRLKTSEKKVVFLDWNELINLYEFTVPENKKYLERVRDVFCFCCFSSLRYSDVANLSSADIFANYITITTVKTADSLKIELNKYSRSILDKYKDEVFSNNKVLPVISNQKMNCYLKELAELVGINQPTRITYYKGNNRIDEIVPKYKLIGTHTARRTFICNALMMGIPAQVVMKWTGHSDYKAMKPYIDVADAARSEAMGLFDKR